jgi:hypothetical protein
MALPSRVRRWCRPQAPPCRLINGFDAHTAAIARARGVSLAGRDTRDGGGDRPADRRSMSLEPKAFAAKIAK